MAALNRGLALGLALLTGCQPDESKPTPQVGTTEPEETVAPEPETEPDEDPPEDDTAPPEDEEEEEEEEVVPSPPALTDLQLLTRLSTALLQLYAASLAAFATGLHAVHTSASPVLFL